MKRVYVHGYDKDKKQIPPTIFARFSESRVNINYLVASFLREQCARLENMGYNDPEILKTLIGTSENEDVFVPYSFYDKGIFIPSSRKFKPAWNVAKEMSQLARDNNKNATKKIEQLKKQYEDEHGHAYEPSLHNPYRGPMVIVKNGIVHMGYTVENVPNPKGISDHTECLPAIIKIVSSEFIPYAKMGINFLVKHKCSFCTLPVSGWEKDPYYLFIGDTPPGCPFC